MVESPHGYAVALLVVSGVVVASVVVRSALARFHLPAAVAFVLIGVGIAAGSDHGAPLGAQTATAIEFLGQIGIVTLLFRVGIESNLPALFKQLRPAALVWVGDVCVSATLGFLAVWLVFGTLIPALFAAAAFSATSVGVSTVVWRERGKLDSPTGSLLVDVAELDDISAMMLVSLLFSLAPYIQVADTGGRAWPLAAETGRLVAVLAAFLAACYLFGRYVEKPLRLWFSARDARYGPVLLAVGIALAVAAGAELLGFSLAIGALFAGLAFSSDPTHRRIDSAFAEIDMLFSPFFFVAIGLSVSPDAFTGAPWIFAVLLVAAIAGKVLGAGLPGALVAGPATGLLIGVSMVPRAEIALIVMTYGRHMGDWAVPQALFDAMVLACLVTAVVAPMAMAWLLERLPVDARSDP